MILESKDLDRCENQILLKMVLYICLLNLHSGELKSLWRRDRSFKNDFWQSFEIDSLMTGNLLNLFILHILIIYMMIWNLNN